MQKKYIMQVFISVGPKMCSDISRFCFNHTTVIDMVNVEYSFFDR